MFQKQKVTKVVEEITGVTCDICGSDCCRINDRNKDFPEFMTLEANWGYGSEKDGQVYTAQVCEECVEKVLKPLIKFKVIDPEEYYDNYDEYGVKKTKAINDLKYLIAKGNWFTGGDILSYLKDNFPDCEEVNQLQEEFRVAFPNVNSNLDVDLLDSGICLDTLVELLSHFELCIEDGDFEEAEWCAKELESHFTDNEEIQQKVRDFRNRDIVNKTREQSNSTFPKGGVNDIELDFGEGEYNDTFLSDFYAYCQYHNSEKANSILTAYEEEHPDDYRVKQARELYNELFN